MRKDRNILLLLALMDDQAVAINGFGDYQRCWMSMHQSREVNIVNALNTLLDPYVQTTYVLPLVGKHGDAFQSSSPCDLPPHAPAPLRPCRGQTQKSAHFRDSKRLRYSVPRHLVGSADYHRFFPQIFYVGLGMVRYVLLLKHLGTIP